MGAYSVILYARFITRDPLTKVVPVLFYVLASAAMQVAFIVAVPMISASGESELSR